MKPPNCLVCRRDIPPHGGVWLDEPRDIIICVWCYEDVRPGDRVGPRGDFICRVRWYDRLASWMRDTLRR